jgi:hypothetical protein
MAIGVLVNGEFGWLTTSSAWPGLAVLSLLGILDWPAACRSPKG